MTITERLADAARVAAQNDPDLATLLDEAATHIRLLELPERMRVDMPRSPRGKNAPAPGSCPLCGAGEYVAGEYCPECSYRG